MYVEDIKKITKENTNFRTVLHTGKNAQIVVMSIPVGGDIGEEVHSNTDQIIFIVDGEGEAVLSGETRRIEEHDTVFVPAGTIHNFKNIGDEDLKLFTVYAPPEHSDGTVHKTKDDAQREEHE
jgi:mannose-6-phosphate isomerase-like protein (cupin superfamily)